MSERRSVRSKFAWLLVVLVTLPLTWSAGWAQSIGRADKVVRYGMSGIVQGQTARIAVVNSAMAAGQVQPGPCRVELMFHDAQGNIVTSRDGVPLDTTVTLVPGQSTFLDLNGDSFSAGGRVGLIPCVKVLCGSNNPSVLGNVVTSVEVFDNSTGRTSYVLLPPPDGD